MRRLLPATAAMILIAGCSWHLHEPAAHLKPDWHHESWRVHCETARSHAPEPGLAPGMHHVRWIWAHDERGEEVLLEGELEDGFLVVRGLLTVGDARVSYRPPSMEWLRKRCMDTLRQRDDDAPLELAAVRAARHGENVDVTMLLPPSGPESNVVRRVVVFGDSLSDTGRLKRRLRVLPRPPYWLGRFSNGPVWLDYIEAHTDLVVQNHSYGGAAITHHDHVPGENLIDWVRESGQFFVSGSIEEQIDDYLDHELVERTLRRADETVFVIWAGGNDYISKEPITGVITTFLNAPGSEAGYEQVVDESIAALSEQVRRLYMAGARKFTLIDLPDLGDTPIVLQNESYLPASALGSETGRRLELALRLSELTDYHNQALAGAIERLRGTSPAIEILALDATLYAMATHESMPWPADGDRFDLGFSLAAQREVLSYGEQTRSFHHACYSGKFLGTSDDQEVCENQTTAFFWDVIHPTTFAHCWQAWLFERALVDAGWITGLSSPDTHRAWCRRVSEHVRGVEASGWMFLNE